MSNFTLKEQDSYYERIRNTYHYVVNSRKGRIGENNIYNFEMDLPPFPYPEHQGSQLGIFKLNSFHICNQDEIDRIPMPQGDSPMYGDSSGFYVIINGIGLRGQIFSNAKSNPVHAGGAGVGPVPSALFQMNSFWIPNTFGKRHIVTADDASGNFNVLSGGYSKKEVICSNPAGSKLNVEVIDADTGERIDGDIELYAVLDFSIEVIPNKISTGNV